VSQSRIVRAESLDPGPLKQNLLPEQEKDRYASKEQVDKVIAVLRKQLRDDQVTTDPDELLGHGHSANTYHSGFTFSDSPTT
jgi:D-lactate dehydrogenase (cytochrome)